MKSFFLAGHQNMCARYDEKFPFAKHLTTVYVIGKLREAEKAAASIASDSVAAVASASAARAGDPVLGAAGAPPSSRLDTWGKYIDTHGIFRTKDRVRIKKTWSGLEPLVDKEATIVYIQHHHNFFFAVRLDNVENDRKFSIF